MPQPRQTLRAPSLAPSLCQSWEAIHPGPTPENTEVNALSDADRGVMGTISKYSDATIGDHVEALLGWFIYMSSRPGFEFEERVHDIIDMLKKLSLAHGCLAHFSHQIDRGTIKKRR